MNKDYNRSNVSRVTILEFIYYPPALALLLSNRPVLIKNIVMNTTPTCNKSPVPSDFVRSVASVSWLLNRLIISRILSHPAQVKEITKGTYRF